MKPTIINRLMILFPVLYMVFRLIFGVIPLSWLPVEVSELIEDFLGPPVMMSILVFLTITYFWKIPKLNPVIAFLLGTNPFLQGTWKGTLHYTFEGDKTKPAFLVIKQNNGFSLDIWLLTDERTSSSTFTHIERYKGSYKLSYGYSTEDSSKNKEINPMHTGFCWLLLDSTDSMKLRGMYYTSRKTVGEMEFSLRNKKAVLDYQKAMRLFL
ncbi:hypothetical protein FACS1894130_05190 [Spirochaetia bacterium]|nr:hypothetical protein FACS1894130_05190 [Spirochaetia bacterium]